MYRLRTIILAAALAVAVLPAAWADGSEVLPGGCGTGAYGNGTHSPTMDPQGRGCVTGGATSAGGSAATPQFTSTTPGTRTIVPLDVATVTTGGTAVTALTAGHRTAGGFLYNPSTATINLCINEQGTASGTTSAGATTCIPPDRTYQLVPNAGAVSVVSSDSAHAFSGMGYN